MRLKKKHHDMFSPNQKWGRPRKGQSALEYMIIFAIVIGLAIVVGLTLSNQVKTVSNSTSTSVSQGLTNIQNLNANLQFNSLDGNNYQDGKTILTSDIAYDNGNLAFGLTSSNFKINGSKPINVTGNDPYMITTSCHNPNVLDVIVTDQNKKSIEQMITINGICALGKLQIQSANSVNIQDTNQSMITASIGYDNGTAITNADISNFFVNDTTPFSVSGSNPYQITTNNATVNCTDPNYLSLKVSYGGQNAGPVSITSTGPC